MDVFDSEKRPNIMRQVQKEQIHRTTANRNIQAELEHELAEKLPGKRASRFCVSKEKNNRVCRRLLLARARVPEHMSCRSSGILAEKARAEHEARQRSNGHVQGTRLDDVADFGVRVEEEKRRVSL